MSRITESKPIPSTTQTVEKRTTLVTIAIAFDPATEARTYAAAMQREAITRIGDAIVGVGRADAVEFTHDEIVNHKDFAAILGLLAPAIDAQEVAIEARKAKAQADADAAAEAAKG